MTEPNQRDVNWLAVNIYREAGTESLYGQYAVGCITLNRVRSRRYPNTVKKVIFQRAQFSWTLIKKVRVNSTPRIFYRVSKKKRYVMILWRRALLAAKLSYIIPCNKFRGIYHYLNPKYAAKWIVARWNRYKAYSFRVGNHVFYKMKKGY